MPPLQILKIGQIEHEVLLKQRWLGFQKPAQIFDMKHYSTP